MTSVALSWSSPPRTPSLSADEIHVWWIDAERWPVERRDWLSPDEMERAGRLREGSRFVGFRCALRAVLAAYLRVDPGDLSFAYGPHGKPRLIAPPAPIGFNLAHSGDHGLLALCAGNDLGVDLERVRPFGRTLEIARRQLGQVIAQELSPMAEPRRTERFFEHWARMEARIKATGGSVFGGAGEAVDCIGFVPRPGWRAALASSGSLPPSDEWRTYALPADSWTPGDEAFWVPMPLPHRGCSEPAGPEDDGVDR